MPVVSALQPAIVQVISAAQSIRLARVAGGPAMTFIWCPPLGRIAILRPYRPPGYGRDGRYGVSEPRVETVSFPPSGEAEFGLAGDVGGYGNP
ncbi:hypothetical protein NSK11_contig00090-0002 [Nocardia seriolae]|uniref:Uncharacterized protein n=1 Tax=Nocardia seriolae TaxID=37332 RepID=A0ABC9YYW8_9NOCA|nr:hypothetical protein NSER024013_56810 [Nocardia seriolae]GAM48682.1 FAD-binding monooxygenase [Nocardia seriolae]GAP30637.1 hypothetical protein NSK11_contig00090-0002 [Nocardia seriolae]GEM26264.1 hypothetical protein NS2_45030 [Nocardia seriolae NBRC 15557]